jgi:hypothetical protein
MKVCHPESGMSFFSVHLCSNIYAHVWCFIDMYRDLMNQAAESVNFFSNHTSSKSSSFTDYIYHSRDSDDEGEEDDPLETTAEMAALGLSNLGMVDENALLHHQSLAFGSTSSSGFTLKWREERSRRGKKVAKPKKTKKGISGVKVMTNSIYCLLGSSLI